MVAVVFRADASSQIGSGHVMRCATLADELRRRGAQTRFVCRELEGHLIDWLEDRGHPVARLATEAVPANPTRDLAQTREAVAGQPVADWLVVDHYDLGIAWESAAHALARQVMVIDDLRDRVHDCDLLLDQNCLEPPSSPVRKLAPSPLSLYGPKYALLRPEFAGLRASSIARQRQPVRRLLICFGGADPLDHTSAALRAVLSHADTLEHIDVLLGNANPHRAAVMALANSDKVRLYGPERSVASLLAEADLAIGAGGVMTWERACLGVPTLAFGIASNQVPVLEALFEQGCAAGVAHMPIPDVGAMGAWLAACLHNAPVLRGLSQRAAALVDGEGVSRVVDLLMPAEIEFRRATEDDRDALLCWRNAHTTRAASLNDRTVGAHEHAQWLQVVLSSNDRVLLIAHHRGEAVGVVRFDIDGVAAAISVYRVPGLPPARLGLVARSVEWLHAQRPDITRLVAEVLPQNATSLASFRSAGFRPLRNVLVKEFASS